MTDVKEHVDLGPIEEAHKLMNKAQSLIQEAFEEPVIVAVYFIQHGSTHPVYERTVLNNVLKAVTAVTGITEEEIKSKCRKRPIVNARRFAVVLLKSLLPYHTLGKIGLLLNIGDHASVLHHLVQFNDLSESDRQFYSDYKKIENALNPHLNENLTNKSTKIQG